MPMATPRPADGFIKVQLILRVLAMVLSSAGMATMLTSDGTVNFFEISMQAHYSYFSAYEFVMAVDAIACASSLLSLVLAFMLSRSEPNPSTGSYFAMFLHDLLMALFMMAGCAAATGVGMVAREGIDQVGWSPICDHVGKFCNKVAISLAFSFMVLLCYLALAVSSANKLKYLARGTNNQVAGGGVTQER